MSKRCIIYCRVSSEAQEANHSLPTQEERCRAYAAEQGWTVVAVESEQHSGLDLHGRVGLQRALSLIEEGGADVLLAYDPDRLSREQLHIGLILDRVIRADAVLQFATVDFENSPVGKFLLSARTFASELEIAKIGERTQRGRHARVSNGQPIPGGKPPFGYRWVDADAKRGGKSKLECDPDEATTVRLIFDLFLDGMSLRSLAAELAKRGILSPSGRASWTAATVRRILTREMYSTGAAVAFAVRYERKPDGGYRTRANSEDAIERIPDVAPPIVSREDQAAALSRLATNQSFSVRNNANPEATLLRAGFIRCGHCGWALRVNAPTTTNTRRYVCNTYRHGRCPNPSIAVSVVDGPVWEQVSALLRDPEVIERELAKLRDDGDLERRLAEAQTRLTTISKKQTYIAAKVIELDDDDAAAPFMEQLKTLSAQKKATEHERDDLQQRIGDAAADRERVRSIAEWCATVAERVEGMSYDEKRLALDALGVQVHVYREGAVNEQGQPLPRWELTADPSSIGVILYHST